MIPEKYKCIGFDADDTLWINETFFREAEEQFCKLLKEYMDSDNLTRELFNTEVKNIGIYGYGIKGFTLSLIETGIKISDGKLSVDIIQKIIEIGKTLLNKPVQLIDGVEELLHDLKCSGYKLIVATKGDLLDQEKKLAKSRLEQYFHHIEVMSDKKESNYSKLLDHLDIEPKDFMMIGNSLKSDILPVLNLGGSAIHIPFHTTWQHEHVDDIGIQSNFWEVESLSEIQNILEL